jgi:hypothetical protein
MRDVSNKYRNTAAWTKAYTSNLRPKPHLAFE